MLLILYKEILDPSKNSVVQMTENKMNNNMSYKLSEYAIL